MWFFSQFYKWKHWGSDTSSEVTWNRTSKWQGHDSSPGLADAVAWSHEHCALETAATPHSCVLLFQNIYYPVSTKMLASVFFRGWILSTDNPPHLNHAIKMAQVILLARNFFLNSELFSVLRIYSPPKIWSGTGRWSCHHLNRYLLLYQHFVNCNV